jgi:hypothetical protein
MSKFVFPIPPKLEGKLINVNKLVAYPRFPEKPDKNCFTIIDSGAFSLYQAGLEIHEKYLKGLAKHYNKYQSKKYKCVAPDVFTKPKKSIENFKLFKSLYPELKFYPVFQFNKLKQIDMLSFYTQIQFYKDINLDTIFISNPFLRAVEAKNQGLEDCIKEIKKVFKNSWVHILGAGWDLEDIQKWFSIKDIDSIDSISYYTSAQYRQEFCFPYQKEKPWDRAIENYKSLKKLCLA